MLLNLKDPESIITWWRVFPDRHSVYLDHKIKLSPEFAPAIMEARRRIAEDPVLSGLLASATQRRSQGETPFTEQDGDVPAHELRWRELAAA